MESKRPILEQLRNRLGREKWDWPEDFVFLREQLTGHGLAAITVYNDAIGALRAGSPDGTGVVVACGTGGATGARNAKGEVWHSSFWQMAGGAGELGNRLLRAVYGADMQMAPPTALTTAVLAHFQMDSVERVLHALTARDSAADFESRFIHPKTGGLARLLLDVADQGDGVARQIVQNHGEALGAQAIVAARKVGLLGQPLSLVLSGGVMHHPSPLLRDAMVDQVRPHCPHIQVCRDGFEPALGAVMLALESRQQLVDAAVREHLRSTQPSATFFDT